jgi:hypothetical protein
MGVFADQSAGTSTTSSTLRNRDLVYGRTGNSLKVHRCHCPEDMRDTANRDEVVRKSAGSAEAIARQTLALYFDPDQA